jgi:hypothetical protein
MKIRVTFILFHSILTAFVATTAIENQAAFFQGLLIVTDAGHIFPSSRLGG